MKSRIEVHNTKRSKSRPSHGAKDRAQEKGATRTSRFTTPVAIAGANAIKNFIPADRKPGPGSPGPQSPLPPGAPPPPGSTPPMFTADGGPPPAPTDFQRRTCKSLSTGSDSSLFCSKNHFWQNWPKTHAYVASVMCFPTSVDEIGAAIRLAEKSSLPLRAVGGGWSFSDAALPGTVTTNRPDATTADKLANSLLLGEGFHSMGPSVAIVDPADSSLIGFNKMNQPSIGMAASGASVLISLLRTGPASVCLINTRSLKSSLQDRLGEILSADAKRATERGKHYFHVEGGITIEELAALLDAQSPRLVLEASGGNPGATLAGSISTGTHGAEFNTPLLIDRVKAIHLVGPGGLQWWIEGDDSIADPNALIARYPCLDRGRIIAGAKRVLGATPQDWLNAVVVSMGCIAVVYSVILELSEVTGMRQVVSQTTWRGILMLATSGIDPLAPVINAIQSASIVNVITDGSFSSQIPMGANVYADLAFNPNRRNDGDFDCWIVNRNKVAIPFDPQPPAADGMGEMVAAVFAALSAAFNGDTVKLAARIGDVYGLVDPSKATDPVGQALGALVGALLLGPAGAILGQVVASATEVVASLNPDALINIVTRIANASDQIDVALDELTRPLAAAHANDLAQPLLSGILAAILGTSMVNPGISIGTSVGRVGFPDQGLVGAGLEVAMSEKDAFPFIQTEILDRMDPLIPFFGYVSVRVCPKTNALLGMPQWDKSVMIEVVSFGDSWGRNFMAGLQTRIVTKIRSGSLDAMLHWGLENEQLGESHLMSIPAMRKPTPGRAEDPAIPNVPLDRISAFKQIRDAIRAAGGSNPSNLFPAFNNAFTARLGFNPKQTIPTPGPTIAVPDVLDLNRSNADRLIIAAGLVPHHTAATSGAAWVGSQTPRPGAFVQPGSTVTLALITADQR